MKTILSILFVAVVGVASANTNEKSSVKVVSEGNNVKVVFKPIHEEDVKIRIIDGDNTTLHTQIVKNTNGFILPVKFDDIENDNLSIQFITSTETITESLSLNTKNTIEYNFSDFININTVPGVKEVSLKSFLKDGTDFNVVIYDEKENAIFTEDLTATQAFERVYKLNDLKSSSIGFSVYHKGRLVKSETVEL